ncbi:MAG: methionyl-tRNA formyltransferase, partial [Acidimicrobiia bacterium]
PRRRGAAPVERALLAGDAETGVDLMRLEVGLDTGPNFARTVVPIEPRATLTSLRTELVRIGSDMLVSELRRGLGAPIDQVGEPTYASKIDPTELEIDWSLPVERIDRLVRLGGAWTTFRGKRLKIIEASLVANDAATAPTLVPVTVQPEGKAPMTFSAWRNGARPDADELFGS